MLNASRLFVLAAVNREALKKQSSFQLDRKLFLPLPPLSSLKKEVFLNQDQDLKFRTEIHRNNKTLQIFFNEKICYRQP